MLVNCHRLYTSSKHFLDLVMQRFNPEDVYAEGQWNARVQYRTCHHRFRLRAMKPAAHTLTHTASHAACASTSR
jgi:hypothetical protein